MELAREVGHAVPGQPVKTICFDCLEGKSPDEDLVPERLVSLSYSRTKYKVSNRIKKNGNFNGCFYSLMTSVYNETPGGFSTGYFSYRRVSQVLVPPINPRNRRGRRRGFGEPRPRHNNPWTQYQPQRDHSQGRGGNRGFFPRGQCPN